MTFNFSDYESGMFFIAGPCVIEDQQSLEDIAGELVEVSRKHGVPFIFKSSFDKANRSSTTSYRGPGLEKGLEMLRLIKEKFEVPILTDIHLPLQAAPASRVADILQIPAFLCRQTDMLEAAAKTSAIVNVKKGQFISPYEVPNIIDKIRPYNKQPVLITERGYMFGYQNLVVDFKALEVMKSYDCRIIFDATHSVMQPGALGNQSGGDYKMAKVLARSAAAVGVHGFFFETHPHPERALSDKNVMIPLAEVSEWIGELKGYYSLAEKSGHIRRNYA